MEEESRQQDREAEIGNVITDIITYLENMQCYAIY